MTFLHLPLQPSIEKWRKQSYTGIVFLFNTAIEFFNLELVSKYIYSAPNRTSHANNNHLKKLIVPVLHSHFECRN